MSKIARIMQQASAGAGGEVLDVDDCFSCFLYDGTNATQTITNGIDLAGEGGLVWQKLRTHPTPPDGQDHYLRDSERGVGYNLESNTTDAQFGDGGITSFNSNGFSLSSGTKGNLSGATYTSWTFRKAPKFFDVISWSGDGTNARQISHSLNAVPHVMITRPYNTTAGGWSFAHYDGSTWRHGELNTTDQMSSPPSAYIWGNRSSFIAPTSSVITVAGPQTGVSDGMNKSGVSYITYLFAHNNNDGEFGPDSDQDIIKCGSYTGASQTEISVDLGFEPQWVMIKRATGTSLAAYASWFIQDTMRGMVAKGADAKDKVLYANKSQAEGYRGNGGSTDAAIQVHPNPTGFTVPSVNSVEVNQANETYIYMAIRRGPLAAPEDATKVFDVTFNPTSPNVPSDTLVDTLLFKSTGSSQSWWVADRLRQGAGNLQTDTTAAESSSTYLDFRFDQMTGTRTVANSFGSNYVGYTWKRAPGYFDVVSYKGTGTGGYANIKHNLGVVPEMVWFKNRDSSSTPRGNWYVYHKDLANSGGYVFLNTSSAEATDYSGWASSTFAPSATQFTVLKGTLHYTNENYIAYFFATVAGVSKVGSYTGNGGTQTIDCGFSNGARFVFTKPINTTGHGVVFDTERGIVAGNDPYLLLNDTNAQTEDFDELDPHSSGFTVNNAAGISNVNNTNYIFYAIA